MSPEAEAGLIRLLGLLAERYMEDHRILQACLSGCRAKGGDYPDIDCYIGCYELVAPSLREEERAVLRAFRAVRERSRESYALGIPAQMFSNFDRWGALGGPPGQFIEGPICALQATFAQPRNPVRALLVGPSWCSRFTWFLFAEAGVRRSVMWDEAEPTDLAAGWRQQAVATWTKEREGVWWTQAQRGQWTDWGDAETWCQWGALVQARYGKQVLHCSRGRFVDREYLPQRGDVYIQGDCDPLEAPAERAHHTGIVADVAHCPTNVRENGRLVQRHEPWVLTIDANASLEDATGRIGTGGADSEGVGWRWRFRWRNPKQAEKAPWCYLCMRDALVAGPLFPNR